MKDRFRKILIVVLCLIAVGCAAYLVWYQMEASKAREANDKAQEAAKEPVQETPAPEEPQVAAPVEIPINFDELQATNPDVYAWIKIDGTNIDYPIVQGFDDSFYLDHSWDGAAASQGAIFTQSYNTLDFQDYNTVIYGHRMGEASPTMFYDLRYYMDMEFMKQHQTVVIYTREHKYTYQIFAGVVYDDRLIMTNFDFTNPEQRQAYLDSINGSTDLRSQYADNVQVTADSRIITMSTCIESEPNHRFLVEAVLVSEE